MKEHRFKNTVNDLRPLPRGGFDAESMQCLPTKALFKNPVLLPHLSDFFFSKRRSPALPFTPFCSVPLSLPSPHVEGYLQHREDSHRKKKS